MRGALMLALALLAAPAEAQDRHSWGGPGYQSTITLEPTDAPGAVAQVTFDNRTVHVDELAVFDLTLDGLTITVEALVGRGLTPDRMTVLVPPGYIADPPEIEVSEDEIGRVLIYEWVGF